MNCSGFDCGEPSLNSFLKKHALNNDRAGLGRTFVATKPDDAIVAGYSTISAGSVTFDVVPEHLAKRLPKYPIPTVHIGRLSVDLHSQGKGLGEALLIDALRKAATVAQGVGVYVVDVIALNDRAKSFYLKYGFTEMLDERRHLFLPIESARRVAALLEE